MQASYRRWRVLGKHPFLSCNVKPAGRFPAADAAKATNYYLGVYLMGNALAGIDNCRIHPLSLDSGSPRTMTFYIFLPAIAVVIATVWLYTRSRHRAQKKTPPAINRVSKDGTEVRCFTCGIWVPKEGALEKKGRYFCGVKKSDRDRVGPNKEAA